MGKERAFRARAKSDEAANVPGENRERGGGLSIKSLKRFCCERRHNGQNTDKGR